MKIAHISDLHLVKRSWNPIQFFSKRWLGNLNSLFIRRKDFDYRKLEKLPSYFQSHGVSHVIISGDLTTTADTPEFELARGFTTSLEKAGLEVICIPGNHDHYTRAAYRNRTFYNYFSSTWDSSLKWNLITDGVTAKKLCPGWWIVGLDTACSTSWVYSTGYFHPRIEKALDELLTTLPENILLVNHFPFFQHESKRKVLLRGPSLQQLIEKYPQVKIYCHGHTHRRCIAPLHASGLPLILDPGSTTHRSNDGWHLIEINGKSYSQHWIPL